MTADDRPTLSASDLARRLGDALPPADSLTAAQLDLVAAARDLLDAVVRTDTDDAARSTAAATLRRVTADLRVAEREPVIVLLRHPGGRFENATQAGSGRLNARSFPTVFDLPEACPEITVGPGPEVTGHCRLDASAGGPPERAHGGVVATVLDEACGAGIVAAGRVGMTVTLTVDYLGPVPLGEPLGIRARAEEVDGRKTWVTAEIVVDDEVRARGRALFVATRPR